MDFDGTWIRWNEKLTCRNWGLSASSGYDHSITFQITFVEALILTDVNRKDYRAWYGLGQAYELLSMHHYALHYYQHATALRYITFTWYLISTNLEKTLWRTTMASSGNLLWRDKEVQWLYQYSYHSYNILRYREAIECLKRALIPADPREITINFKLAKLHQLLDEPTEAVAYHRRVVEVCQTDS